MCTPTCVKNLLWTNVVESTCASLHCIGWNSSPRCSTSLRNIFFVLKTLFKAILFQWWFSLIPIRFLPPSCACLFSRHSHRRTWATHSHFRARCGTFGTFQQNFFSSQCSWATVCWQNPTHAGINFNLELNSWPPDASPGTHSIAELWENWNFLSFMQAKISRHLAFRSMFVKEMIFSSFFHKWKTNNVVMPHWLHKKLSRTSKVWQKYSFLSASRFFWQNPLFLALTSSTQNTLARFKSWFRG